MMRTKVSKKLKWIIGSVLGVVLVGGVSSAAYAAHYGDLVLPHTTIAGHSLAGQSRDEAQKVIENQVANATVTITVTGGDTTAQPVSVTLAQAGVNVDTQATVDAVMQRNTGFFSRMGALFSNYDVPVVYQIDDATFQKFADQFSSDSNDPVQNAAVVLKDGSFQVIPAQAGQGVDTHQLKTAVEQAAQTLTSVSQSLQMQEIQPTVSTEQAQTVADEATKLTTINVTLKTPNRSLSASEADKASWVTLPEKCDGTSKPEFDAEKVSEWVKTTTESTNDAAVKGIKNLNSRGDVVAVAKKATPSYVANNTDQLAQAAVEAVTQGKDYEGSITYDVGEEEYDTRTIADGAEGMVYQAAPGEKWIDVNLSNDTVTAYEGTTIMQGPIAMVPGAPETPTVTGIYHVYLKNASQTMRGKNADGTDYVTPGVPWITYFTGSYALHGAPWRSSFGWSGPGGSHGCVNMPVDGAKWIYDWADIGTTVVSHY